MTDDSAIFIHNQKEEQKSVPVNNQQQKTIF